MEIPARRKVSFVLYYAGLLLLVASLALSKFGMSIAQFMLAGSWIIWGDTGLRIKKFLQNKVALLITSVFVMHVLGLLWTSDFQYAFKDLRIKLPLLILPLIFSTSPVLSVRQFNAVLYTTVTGVFISTLISTSVYLGLLNYPVVDIRDISIFISHIRLSLLICVSVIILVWMGFNEKNFWLRAVSVILICWFVAFLALLESLTGILILLSLSLFFLIFRVIHSSGWRLRVLIVTFILLIPASALYYVYKVNESFRVRSGIGVLETVTPSGHRYVHDTGRNEFENGYAVWNYVCEPEMEKEWNLRSHLLYYGKDAKNQDLRFTLIRFLTSKGLRKDSSGVWALSNEELHAVENGIANVYYMNSGNFKSRIHQVLWEIYDYRNGGDPSGHSVVQRLEFWKAALGIIKKNPLYGVGTGDVPDAFSNEYVSMHSKLSEQWRLRSHNQFLSIAVAFGIAGLLWFLFTIRVPLKISFKRHDSLYVAFAVTAVLSMLTEDTLETQAGVTFFALFSCLFLFVNPINRGDGVN